MSTSATTLASIPECDRFPDERPAFDFSLTSRNLRLEAAGVKHGGLLKTGTTICGVRFRDGVVVAADTRSTMGDVVAEKFCSKTHVLAPNIAAVGAGTAADLQKVTEMIASNLRLQRLFQGTQSKCSMARALLQNHLFPHMGYVGCNLIVGGVDADGVHLFDMMSAASTHSGPFMAMGSGGTFASAVLEHGYHDDMDEAAAFALAARAISAGILNDLYSGSQADIMVVTAAGIRKTRGAAFPSPKDFAGSFIYPRGGTVVLAEKRRAFKYEVLSETVKRRTEEVAAENVEPGATAVASPSGMRVD